MAGAIQHIDCEPVVWPREPPAADGERQDHRRRARAGVSLYMGRRRGMPGTRWHDLFEPSPDCVELELPGFRGWLTKQFWRSPFAGPDRLHALGGFREMCGKRTRSCSASWTKTSRAPASIGPDQALFDTRGVLRRHRSALEARRTAGNSTTSWSDERRRYDRQMRAFYRGLRPVATVTEMIDRLMRDFAPRVAIGNDGTADIQRPHRLSTDDRRRAFPADRQQALLRRRHSDRGLPRAHGLRDQRSRTRGFRCRRYTGGARGPRGAGTEAGSCRT